uniref:Scaffold attachment factor B n=4 Tax=Cercopithecinae TaxID=9528 RepID=A0A2K5LF73_CERAT
MKVVILTKLKLPPTETRKHRRGPAKGANQKKRVWKITGWRKTLGMDRYKMRKYSTFWGKLVNLSQ